jgi:hypothetical protein
LCQALTRQTDIETVARPEDAGRGQHEANPLVGERRSDPEVSLPRDAEALHARLHEVLIAESGVELVLVVVAHDREVGEVEAQDGVDLRLPEHGKVDVVEVTEVEHGVRTFPTHQLEHGDGPGAEALVTEEGDLEVRRRKLALREGARSGDEDQTHGQPDQMCSSHRCGDDRLLPRGPA